MPTHLLLEGADIESVLSQLRDSHGPDAKIVQAELVRTGGFAGFFAKRRYEVTVEVDDDQLAAASTPAVAAMAAMTPASPGSYGIDALLSAAEDGDRALIGSPSVSQNPPAATVSAADAADAAGPETDAPPLAGPGWHRPVSTEGNAFSDVLDSLTRSLAEQQREPEPPFEPFAAYGIPRPRVQSPEPAPSIGAADPEGQPDPFDQLDPFGQIDTVSPARPFIAPVPMTPPVPPIPAEIAKAVKASASAKRPVVDLAPTRAQLAGLGVPPQLLEHLSSAEPVLALWDVVGTRPAPKLPVLRPSATRGGALVVVVGSWAAARGAVDGLVAESGLSRDAVFAVGASAVDEVPAERTVRSHAAAVDLVRASRQTHGVTLLLVDPGQGMHSAARVAQLVVTLEPQFVLVASDAGEELGTGLTALDALEEAGVTVDAIALDGVARAERPAAIFEVPIAVSWIDGRVATPGSWIGLLMDTLTTRGEQRTTRTGHRC